MNNSRFMKLAIVRLDELIRFSDRPLNLLVSKQETTRCTGPDPEAEISRDHATLKCGEVFGHSLVFEVNSGKCYFLGPPVVTVVLESGHGGYMAQSQKKRLTEAGEQASSK